MSHLRLLICLVLLLLVAGCRAMPAAPQKAPAAPQATPDVLTRYAALISSGQVAEAAELLAPNLRTMYSADNYVALRNTPSMEIISVKEVTGSVNADVGARDLKVADYRVFLLDVRYRVLDLVPSSFVSGEVYHHKATLIRLTPDGPWLISELSGYGNPPAPAAIWPGVPLPPDAFPDPPCSNVDIYCTFRASPNVAAWYAEQLAKQGWQPEKLATGEAVDIQYGATVAFYSRGGVYLAVTVRQQEGTIPASAQLILCRHAGRYLSQDEALTIAHRFDRDGQGKWTGELKSGAWVFTTENAAHAKTVVYIDPITGSPFRVANIEGEGQ